VGKVAAAATVPIQLKNKKNKTLTIQLEEKENPVQKKHKKGGLYGLIDSKGTRRNRRRGKQDTVGLLLV